MQNNDISYDLCLASASPRREALLKQIGLDCLKYPVDLDESVLPGESAPSYVMRLAEQKALAGQKRSGTDLPVLGSDTSVVFNGKILGKPRDRRQAVDMLMQLSGKTHQVMTGVAVCQHNRVRSIISVTDVSFRALSEAECHAYCDTGEPFDKAGGYGIQGLAAVFVRSVSGSYSNVVGLPLFETADLLKQFGIRVLEPS
ncbi:Maf family protein [Oceanospirillum sanctuarii]|uniref:Maf family protein n=1 Tax=Oceanospirillum sanctuarii TaxID=1434821 RepID=UPI000A3BD62C|nr:Maf family protein [Oceanospirillum sanctuarii]